ncbi:uncharacterized protein FIBRA_00695 [Fibroporia radiculosa]|uniref:Glutaredoxin domain-containing protein n=1 Tax=Fibroporia radiculosa TaxID=599839 RepID=J4HS14_9APHY|nr:uncharacterized protein FIBRA_00695 [Fibroporia radiculosa]CCL98692.1 predicted protein [Fibroporia radiculosa]
MASTYRRRRIVWSFIFLAGCALFYVSTHDISSWSIPASLKDLGFSPSSSRAGQVAIAKLKDIAQRQPVDEVQGLLYFVTQYTDRRLVEDDGLIAVEGLGRVAVDPEDKVDLRVYAPDGDDKWESHLRVLTEEYPLVVFSKTYCPFSQRAKALLGSYAINPSPFVVELNTRSDGPVLQKILARVTGRRTVPNVLLHGKSIGGSDDIHALHESHQLKRILEEAGLEVNGPVVDSQADTI